MLATVSCTGYANPGLDVHLAKDLGMRPNCSPISKSFSPRDRQRPQKHLLFLTAASYSVKKRGPTTGLSGSDTSGSVEMKAMAGGVRYRRDSAIRRAVEMRRRSGPSDRTGPESSRLGRPEPLALGNASRNRASAAGGASVVSRDDASPDAVHDLLTDAQLAARWQLSRGTLANQRSQGRGPAYLKLAGRVRYRRSDIEAYEQAGFVSREPAANYILR